MDSQKRTCIFTGLPADSSLKIVSSNLDKHNWAKSVPCTKQMAISLKDRSLTDLEFRLVELFYQQELARLRVQHCEEQILEIRTRLGKELETELARIEKEMKLYVSKSDLEKTEPTPIKEKTEEIAEINSETQESHDTIIKKVVKKDLWD